MKRRHISATLLMAIALAGCGMNPVNGVTGQAQAGDGAQAAQSAIDARYNLLTIVPECPTLTNDTFSSTGSTTTSGFSS